MCLRHSANIKRPPGSLSPPLRLTEHARFREMMRGIGSDLSAMVRVTRRRRTLQAFAYAALLILTTCHRPTGSQPVVTIEHEIAPQPARVGPAKITLRLKNEAGKAVAGAKITIEGNMSHAGMGPAFGTATEMEPGRYQAPLAFSMGGDWIILIHLTLSDGQRLERQFEVKGVRSE